MEEETAVGSGKDRPPRSRRPVSAVTAPQGELSADQALLMSASGTTQGLPPGDQVFQSLEKVPAKELSESGLIQSVSDSTDVPGAGSGRYCNGTEGVQSPPLDAAPLDRQMDGHNGTLAGPPVRADLLYEGSVMRVPPPRSFPPLPANTTDDAKLVDHYEQTIGFSASGMERERLDQRPPATASHDPSLQSDRQQLYSGAQTGQGVQCETPPERGANKSAITVRSETPQGNVPEVDASAVPKSQPLELGLVQQLAELGQPKQAERAVVSPIGNKALASKNGSGVLNGDDSETVRNKAKNSQPEPSGAARQPTDNGSQVDQDGGQDAQPAQSLKDILANIVLEEQVITIKLHRDTPSNRRSRRDRLPWSRAGPASATDIRAPGMLAAHAEDQVPSLASLDRWSRLSTRRAISNIETRQDSDVFPNTTDAPQVTTAIVHTNNDPPAENGVSRIASSSSSVMRRTISDGAFVQDPPQAVAGPSRQEKPPPSTKQVRSSRPTSSAAALAEEERLKRLNVVVQHTGRRSAPVFSRRGFGTAEFWNSGQTSINRAILKQIFSRPLIPPSGRRPRAQDRDQYGRERSLSVGAERRGHRSKRLLSSENAEREWRDGRSSAPAWASKGRKSRRKLASYGSMEERCPRYNQLEEEENGGGADVMSSRYYRDREDWGDVDDILVEELFREGALPRVRGPGGASGFRAQRRSTSRNAQQDPSGHGRVSASRPLSVQDRDFSVEVVPGRTSRAGRRGGEEEEEGDTGSSSSSSEDDESAALLKETKTEIYGRRWYLLFLFSMTALVWNAIWSTWGPIAQSAKQVYSWSDGDIAMFTWLGNLPFLITMFPIAYLMDVKGMRTATVLCCGLMCLGAGLRCIPCDTVTATWLIRLGQLLNGVAGTVPISGPGLLSGLWFPPNQRATATAISTVSGYLGSCISFVLGPLLVKEPSLSPVNGSSQPNLNELLGNSTEIEEQKQGIEMILYSEFAAAALLFILVVVYFPSKPPMPPSISASVPREEYLAGLKHLVRNKQFWVTAIAYSVPIGVYEVWQVVLDVILDPKVSQQTAGWMDFYATIGGCISGLLISRFADLFTRQMKVFLLVFYSLAAASMLWFSLLAAGVLPFDVGMVYAAMVVGGVFLDGGAPLFFELVIEVSYPVGEGVTSGCLQMICAGAGVLFLSLVEVQSMGKDWMNWLFTGCITLAIPLLFFIKTNYGRADIDDIDLEISSSSSSSSCSSSSEDEEEKEKEERKTEDVEKGRRKAGTSASMSESRSYGETV